MEIITTIILLSIVGLVFLILLGRLLTAWIFRINDIIKLLKKSNELLNIAINKIDELDN